MGKRVLTDIWTSVAISLLIGLFFVFVVVPVLSVYLFTLFDVFARMTTV